MEPVKYICDCGAQYSDTGALLACANSNHGKGQERMSDSTFDRVREAMKGSRLWPIVALLMDTHIDDLPDRPSRTGAM